MPVSILLRSSVGIALASRDLQTQDQILRCLACLDHSGPGYFAIYLSLVCPDQGHPSHLRLIEETLADDPLASSAISVAEQDARYTIAGSARSDVSPSGSNASDSTIGTSISNMIGMVYDQHC
jgi:hypothetical protein